MIKSFRAKILLLTSTTAFILIALLTAWDVYRFEVAVEKVMIEEMKDYARTQAIYLADSLYYGDYDKIEELLETNPASQIKDILVLDKTGYIIASKERGIVLFERFPYMEDLKGVENSKIIAKNSETLLVQPIGLGDELLGYIVLSIDTKRYHNLLKQEIYLSLGTLVLSFMFIFFFVNYMSLIFAKRTNFALRMLREIGEGNLDLPPPPKTGDEFEELYLRIRDTAQRLKESMITRDYYTSVVNSLVEALVVVDDKGIIVDANLSFCRLLGTSCKAPLNKPISQVLPQLVSVIEDYGRKGETEPIELVVSGKKRFFLPFIGSYKNLLIITLNDVTELIDYQRKLEELSQKDPLTGVLNRRAMGSVLSSEVERARRYGRPLSLIYMDLDNFKKVNDTYGHAVGDLVLKRFVDVVNEKLRKTDFLARWGGEEFVALLPETGLEGARRLAERIRTAIEEENFGKPGRITVSMGVTQFRQDDTVETFLSRADKALYQAKRKGKNRVEVA